MSCEESIKLIKGEINVRPTGEVEIKEVIQIQAEGKELLYGILRGVTNEIPGNKKIPVPIICQITKCHRNGAEETCKNAQICDMIPLGDEKKPLLRGIHTYNLEYVIKGAVENLPSNSRLKLNFMAPTLAVPIEYMELTINLKTPLANNRAFLGKSFWLVKNGKKGTELRVIEEKDGALKLTTSYPLPPQTDLWMELLW